MTTIKCPYCKFNYDKNDLVEHSKHKHKEKDTSYRNITTSTISFTRNTPPNPGIVIPNFNTNRSVISGSGSGSSSSSSSVNTNTLSNIASSATSGFNSIWGRINNNFRWPSNTAPNRPPLNSVLEADLSDEENNELIHTININIRNYSAGEAIDQSYTIDPTKTVTEFKNIIRTRQILPGANILLVHRGRILHDTQKIENFNINDNDTVNMIIRTS
jgi:hypothetical protein